MKQASYFKLMLIGTCLILAVVWFGLWMPVVFKKDGIHFIVRPGVLKAEVIKDLSEQGLAKIPLLLSIYTHVRSNNSLKTGEYLFPRGSTPVSIWAQITEGKGLVYHSFTIIPGWTFQQIKRELSRQNLTHYLPMLTDKEVMKRLHALNLDPEGQFYPETYYYTIGNSDLILLKRAYQLMQRKLDYAWKNRAKGLPYKNSYQALIAASLIEKEGYLDSERPRIAGVLINRLKKDMLLQFDPTIIYGLGEHYDGKIHKNDLTSDTPYNTYLHKGLPPTPIAMPGLPSIKAALQPEKNDYFYFVAKRDGSHYFSKNLIEHHAAVKRLQKVSEFFNTSLLEQYIVLALQD